MPEDENGELIAVNPVMEFNAGHSGYLLEKFHDQFEQYAVMKPDSDKPQLTVPVDELVRIINEDKDIASHLVHKMAEELGNEQMKLNDLNVYKANIKAYEIKKMDPEILRTFALKDYNPYYLHPDFDKKSAEDCKTDARNSLSNLIDNLPKVREKIHAVTEFLEGAGEIIQEIELDQDQSGVSQNISLRSESRMRAGMRLMREKLNLITVVVNSEDEYRENLLKIS